MIRNSPNHYLMIIYLLNVVIYFFFYNGDFSITRFKPGEGQFWKSLNILYYHSYTAKWYVINKISW